MNKTGLSDEIHEQMQRVFIENTMIERVILFGSRAKGNYKYNSDIDLAIIGGDNALFYESILLLLNELPTLCKFDVIDYSRISNEQLKSHIDRVGIVIFDRTDEKTLPKKPT